MINDASEIPAGSNAVLIIPELFREGLSGKQENIGGLTHKTTPANIYWASLEAHSYYVRYGIEKLQCVGNFKARNLICVGGERKTRCGTKYEPIS